MYKRQALHRFEGAEAAEFAFDGDADAVGHFNHATGDFDVVVVGGDRLAVYGNCSRQFHTNDITET